MSLQLDAIEMPYRFGDHELARRFYGGLHGLTETSDPRSVGILSFKLGELELRLIPEGFGVRRNVVSVHRVATDVALRDLSERGYLNYDTIKDAGVSIVDPFGNGIELATAKAKAVPFYLVGWAA